MFNNIYFSFGGFYALYYNIGAIRELHSEYNKPDSKLSRKINFYGVSAGASAAILCYLVFENLITIDKLFEIIDFIKKFNAVNLDLTPITISIIDNLFDNCPNDLYLRISNIIHIGVTTKNGYKQISKFNSNADVYNAILCSCSVAGASSYDSKICGESCIDGAYSFKYEYIPEDTVIIRLTEFSTPLTLTIPPLILRTYLIDIGKENVIVSLNKISVMNKNKKNIVLDVLDINWCLLINELTHKNPIWKTHIESKTKSKITDDIKLNASLFDVINYIHYSVLNHSH
jgi:hypothetical protein